MDRIKSANLVEVVEFFRFDNSAQECPSLEVLARAESHGDQVHRPVLPSLPISSTPKRFVLPHLVHNGLRNPLAVLLTSQRLGIHHLHKERSHGFMEISVVLSVVRAVVSIA